MTLALSAGAGIVEAEEKLKRELRVSGAVEVRQLPSQRVVQSPHELEPPSPDTLCEVQLCRPADRSSRVWRRQKLMRHVTVESVRVEITEGSIVISISNLPAWAAAALASIALGGDPDSKFHNRMCEILSDSFSGVTGELRQVCLDGVEQMLPSDCKPYTESEFDRARDLFPPHELDNAKCLLRDNAGRVGMQ